VILLGALCTTAAAFLLLAQLTGHGDDLRLRMPGSRRARSGPSRAVWLRQADVGVTPSQFRAVSIALGVGTLVVVWGLTGSLWVGIVPGLVAGRGPHWYFGHRRTERLGRVVAAWPDGIRHIVASARSRGTVHQALLELVRSGPAPLAEAFEGYPNLSATAGARAAMEVIREELADPISDQVIEVLIVAHDQGQAITMRILRDLASLITEDLKTQDEIQTAGLEHRMDARLTFVLPWVVLVALCLSGGDYRAFYASGWGAVVVAIGGAMCLGGIAWVERLGRIPTQRRVLGAASGASR
jgi:Flp pilus assembly protein TadB